jgi:hypothetical protein
LAITGTFDPGGRPKLKSFRFLKGKHMSEAGRTPPTIARTGLPPGAGELVPGAETDDKATHGANDAGPVASASPVQDQAPALADLQSDAHLRCEIETRLAEDPWLNAAGVTVSVVNGEVTLTGDVADRYTKRRADDCVKAVPGIGRVRNDLRYRSFFVRNRPGSTTGS